MNLWNLAGVEFTENKALNLTQMTIMDYYRRLRMLAVSMFDWKGLPESVNIRYLEASLFETGRCLFFKDKSEKGLSYLALKCTIAKELNVYMEPTNFIAISNNYSQEYSISDSVLIRNNYDSLPTAVTVMLFSQRLGNAERSIDVNVNAQKTPVLILVDDKQRLTLKNIYSQYEGNEPVIFGNSTINPNLFTVLKTDAPFVADKLMLYKHNILNECLTFLGINNANTDKKERLITDEAQANNQVISASADAMLATRQQAAEQINKMFGLNITVQLRNVDNTAATSVMESEEPKNG